MKAGALLSAGALVTAGMLAGRLLGLLREMLVAAQFGTGHGADNAITLLIIPDFVTSALIGAAASATLVPAFAAREGESALALFWQALAFAAASFALVGLAIFLFAPALPGLALTLCALPLTAATAVATAWLQQRGRFTIPAFATVIFNAVILLVLWLAPTRIPILAAGIVLAALARLAAHLGSFIKGGGHLPASPWSPWQLKRELLKSYFNTAANGLCAMLPQYAPYAVLAAAGGIAVFNYAFKLVLLPGMLGQTIIALILLPWLVQVRKASPEKASSAQGLALQLAWLVAFCACLALSLVGDALAQICFGYGKMTPDDIASVGKLFTLGVWAVPGMLLTSLWQQIWYAEEQTALPLKASIIQSIAILPLAWLGYRLLGTAGVLVAYALVQTLAVPLLARHVALPRIYLKMTLVSLATFTPLALMFAAVAPSPVAAVVVAMIIGALILLAGALANPTLIAWVRPRIERA